MINTGLSGFGFRVLDRLIDRSPVMVPKLFQRAFLGIAGSQNFHDQIFQRYARQLREAERFDKLLVIADVNIGDAVIMQSAIRALKDCFPDAAIDYACNTAGGTLVTPMPGARRVYNIFKQFSLPSAEDIAALQNILQRERYDVVFNLCGFINLKKFKTEARVITLYVPWSAEIVRRWGGGKGKIHLTSAIDTVIRSLVATASQVNSPNTFPAAANVAAPAKEEATIFLAHDAILEARKFLDCHDMHRPHRAMLLHADAPFRWTQIPVQTQIEFLEKISRTGEVSHLFLSCGNASNGLEEKILGGLSSDVRARIIVVPRMSIAAYSAFIDACDVFVSGDTGTLHVAAARKVPLHTRDTLRNRTAVIGVFGATDSRMSGYDSYLPDHIAGSQDAPAKVFVAAAPCRNISCLAKPAKSCSVVRCFDGLSAMEISEYVIHYFKSLPHQETHGRKIAEHA